MKVEEITLCRIRLAQRILVCACDADPELLTDTSWQKAMVHTGALLAKADLMRPEKKLHRAARLEKQIGGKSDEETLREVET